MAEILLAVAAGVGVYKGYQWVAKKMNAAHNVVIEAANVAGRAKSAIKDMPKLIRDPISGVYRVKK
ncbi:MAG: hypothetical protein HRU28_18170 [Rhizobiales bacterium]|nr:hypothetical protein [Hyphomicrobiales bacterium]